MDLLSYVTWLYSLATANILSLLVFYLSCGTERSFAQLTCLQLISMTTYSPSFKKLPTEFIGHVSCAFGPWSWTFFMLKINGFVFLLLSHIYRYNILYIFSSSFILCIFGVFLQPRHMLFNFVLPVDQAWWHVLIPDDPSHLLFCSLSHNTGL